MTAAGRASKARETRAGILDATVAAIARGGARSVRINQIAADAGVSSGLVYYHFRDRQELVRAGLAEAVERYDPRPLSPDGRSSEVHLVDELVRHIGVGAAGEGRARVRMAGLQAAVFDAELRPATRRTTDEWERAIAELVGATSARFDASAAREVAVALTALADGMRQRVTSGVLGADEARRLLVGAVQAMLDRAP